MFGNIFILLYLLSSVGMPRVKAGRRLARQASQWRVPVNNELFKLRKKTVAVRQFPQRVMQCLDFIGDFDTIIVGATALLPPLNLGENYRCLFPDNVVS